MRFGIDELFTGFSLLPVLVGLFAVSQVMGTAFNKNRIAAEKAILTKISGIPFSLRDLKGQLKNILISAGIGRHGRHGQNRRRKF
jgi:putative tricarboxylic transport membrane protein